MQHLQANFKKNIRQFFCIFILDDSDSEEFKNNMEGDENEDYHSEENTIGDDENEGYCSNGEKDENTDDMCTQGNKNVYILS